ncbi:hypothetical protein [Helicobacter sp. T3_23-1056]
MRLVCVVLIFCSALFAEVVEELTLKDTDIVRAYYEIKPKFTDSYYLPQSITIMDNIAKMFDDLESEIYGYKSLKVQWHNENKVTITLNAFENGERICTYRSYEISLRQTGKDTQGVIKSSMLYPQDIDSFLGNVCECNYYRGEEAYNESRQKELDKKIEQYCKPLPQVYKALQEKYKDKPKMQEILKKANDL